MSSLLYKEASVVTVFFFEVTMNVYNVFFIDTAFMEMAVLNILQACMIHSIEKGDSNS